MSELSPKAIVQELDKHIIGQSDAKKAVSIALRNRWRRMQVDERMQVEIKPKNILMIGPTGVGKTEIARRLACLANAPFIKIEATKFTEVGYVGRDAESIVRDLVDVAIKMARSLKMTQVEREAEDMAEEMVLDILLPPADNDKTSNANESESSTRQIFRKRLREGQMDDRMIEVEISDRPSHVEIMGPPGMEEMSSQLHEMFQNFSQDKKSRRNMSVKKALQMLTDEQAQNLVDEDEIKLQALNQVEQSGIVFIDELDKVASGMDNHTGGGVSREGVQRDLLPLIEGCSVSTKYGMVNTDHMLFIASGAFHLSKPSDLIPELQGRLPIRVNLRSLEVEDFKRILVEPDASLTEQYIALMKTEGLDLSFDDSAINKIAEVSWAVNENTENIGARRLHTVMERLLEQVSFDAFEKSDESLIIDEAFVDTHLKDLANDEDLSRYIL